MDSDEKSKKHPPRVAAVDLARGAAVLFMIAVHVQMVYAAPDTAHSPLGVLVDFAGGPLAAPVFMFLMGLSFPLSSKKNFARSLLRGMKILLSGYVLNFFRLVLPIWIGRMVPEGATAFGLDIASLDYGTLLLIGDILQFAGIAIIILAVLERFAVPSWIVAAAAATISLTAPFLWPIAIDMPVLRHATDLLWGNHPLPGLYENAVCFPAFPWLAFPLAGLILGRILKRSEHPVKILERTWIAGIVIAIPGAIILAIDFERQFNDYYHARFGSVCAMIGIVLIWLSLCSLVDKYVHAERIKAFFGECSRNVTIIYVVQWIIIAWTTFLVPIGSLGFAGTWGLIAGTTVVSFFAARLAGKISRILNRRSTLNRR